MFRYLPESASEHAPAVDWVHDLITDLSVFFTVAICGTMLYFAFRYRQRDGVDHETPRIEGSHFFEVIWTVLPTIVSVFLAYYGIVVYREMRTVAKDAYSIDVMAWQWRWDFKYANGKKTSGEAVIPVDKPVKFVMTSGDVLHSFFIPAMRVKSDVIKNRYTYVTFKPIKTGTYNVFCTEYCGKDHSGMLAKLRVVSESEYQRWLEDKGPSMPPADLGAKLYKDKGCNACHDIQSGVRIVGPSWVKLFGSTRKFVDGSTVAADENYLRESILEPNKQVVDGFAGIAMPAFAGQLSEDEISGLIAFIKTLDGSKPAVAQPTPAAAAVDLSKLSPAERGKHWYSDTRYNCNTCHSIDGTRVVGPTLKGLMGRSEQLEDGSTVTVDEAYLAESVKQPNAKIVKSYPAAMPALPVTDAELKDLIEFIKTLK